MERPHSQFRGIPIAAGFHLNTVSDEKGRFSFDGLPAGTECVIKLYDEDSKMFLGEEKVSVFRVEKPKTLDLGDIAVTILAEEADE